jgi:hypothetical protein
MESGQQKRSRTWPAEDGTWLAKEIQNLASSKGCNLTSKKALNLTSNKEWNRPAITDVTWPAKKIRNLTSNKEWNLASKKDTEPGQQ